MRADDGEMMQVWVTLEDSVSKKNVKSKIKTKCGFRVHGSKRNGIIVKEN